MERPALEVADIFRDHGPAWREANKGHVSRGQMKVMSAIERCRTAALGGHVARCENAACGHTVIAYCSCRNRHCPKCQGAAAREWLAEREAELLPVPYFHVVYTLPAPISDIAYTNKAVIYDLLFKASAETTLTIAATRRHLGARIGFMSVLHTWGSALTHHPHVHMVVPGGGLSADGSKWIACRPDYFLCVEVLSALFRRLFLEMLVAAHEAGRLKFFGNHVGLAHRAAFDAYIAPLREIDWVVYAKEPFAGPEEVLRYLSRYTHRIAISNRRLIAADEKSVTFKYKDYRIEGPGHWTAQRPQCRPFKSLVIDRHWRSAPDRGHQRSRQRSNRHPRASFRLLGCLDRHPWHSPATCSMVRSHQHHHVAQAQIPIAPDAPSALHLPRFRPLASCGRRPQRRCYTHQQPASATLHRRRRN